jgi:hypothetical protein
VICIGIRFGYPGLRLPKETNKGRYTSSAACKLLGSLAIASTGAHRHGWPAGFRPTYRHRLFRRGNADVEP